MVGLGHHSHTSLNQSSLRDHTHSCLPHYLPCPSLVGGGGDSAVIIIGFLFFFLDYLHQEKEESGKRFCREKSTPTLELQLSCLDESARVWLAGRTTNTSSQSLIKKQKIKHIPLPPR